MAIPNVPQTAALVKLSGMIQSGATPADVADWAMSLPHPLNGYIARLIEDKAAPGTYAEAIFEIMEGAL